jgi:hypothetical protein
MEGAGLMQPPVVWSGFLRDAVGATFATAAAQWSECHDPRAATVDADRLGEVLVNWANSRLFMRDTSAYQIAKTPN